MRYQATNSASKWLMLLAALVALCILAMPGRALADDDDPPNRAARLSYTSGAVSFNPAGSDDWVDAVVNPLPVLRYAVRNDPGFRYTAVWDTRVVGINARLEDKELLAEINRHLADLKREGFLAKLETKWFGPNQ